MGSARAPTDLSGVCARTCCRGRNLYGAPNHHFRTLSREKHIHTKVMLAELLGDARSALAREQRFALGKCVVAVAPREQPPSPRLAISA